MVTLGHILLTGQKLIVPFEVIGGRKHVSSLVIVSEGARTLFLMTESDKDVGVSAVTKSDLSDQKIEEMLAEQHEYIEFHPSEVRVEKQTFRYEGELETVISEISLMSSDGQTLRLSSDGAAYPYSLLLLQA